MKAIVKNGRLILDEPTDLPEGTEVDLEPASGDPAYDSMTPAQRAEVHALVEDGLSAAKRGETISFDDLKRELKFRP